MKDISTTIYLGMGANLGDRAANLHTALDMLSEKAPVKAVSSLYETPPFGVTDQPSFYNAVCCVATALPPHGLLALVKRIEYDLGRRPGLRWGPRPIDLDILLYGSETVDDDDLTIPHIGIPERAFVLVPLAELAPDLVHPTLREAMTTLLGKVDQSEIKRITGPEWAGSLPRT